MASKNNNPSRAAANLLLSPSGLQQILRLQSLEDRGRIITAAAEYFLSDYKQTPRVEGALCDFVFVGIKDGIDRNEQHCAETREKNRKGGQATQQRRREAMSATPPATSKPAKRTKGVGLPDCTLANLRAFAIDHGKDPDEAEKIAQGFWDYNLRWDKEKGAFNIDETSTGELKLTTDAKGRPLYDWQKAFIGFVNSGYDRAEWERANGIDPKMHKPCQR